MRRLISWLIMLPAAVAVVVFALHNKEPVALNLWPFAMVIEIEVYLLLTGVLAAGVVLGGVVSWAGAGRVRSELRKASYNGEVTRRQLESEYKKSAQLEAELKALKSLQSHVNGAPGDDPHTIEHAPAETAAGQLPKPQSAA